MKYFVGKKIHEILHHYTDLLHHHTGNTRFVGCYLRNGVDANAVTVVDEALFDKYFV